MAVADLLSELATCLCAQIETDGLPKTCFCGLVPGVAAVSDYGGDCDTACGMAWVRLMSAYPAEGVGNQSETVGNCGKELGLEIEVGILRCVSVSSDGSAPSDAELLAATQLQHDDMLTMFRAIACCPSVTSKDYIIRAYEPVGPMGGQVGGTWTVSVVA